MARGGQVVVFADNLRFGGGVQVAASFLDELADLLLEEHCLERFPWLADLRICASPEVVASLAESRAVALVKDRHLNRRWALLGRADVAFHVFGARYGLSGGRSVVSGFADGTMLYEGDQVGCGQPEVRAGSIRRKFRNHLARRWFRRCGHVITETAVVKQRLVERFELDHDRVSVVPNVVNGVFLRDSTRSIARPDDNVIWALYVARAYPHKNHRILGEVAETFAHITGRELRFMLTLAEEEWAGLDQKTREFSINLGIQAVPSLPAVYASAHVVFFPSLLESFSVTPLEAMAVGRPLVASDRDFVRTTCGDYPVYVDPCSSADCAAGLWKAVARDNWQPRRGEGTARMRAVRYIEILDRQLAMRG